MNTSSHQFPVSSIPSSDRANQWTSYHELCVAGFMSKSSFSNSYYHTSSAGLDLPMCAVWCVCHTICWRRFDCSALELLNCSDVRLFLGFAVHAFLLFLPSLPFDVLHSIKMIRTAFYLVLHTANALETAEGSTSSSWGTFAIHLQAGNNSLNAFWCANCRKKTAHWIHIVKILLSATVDHELTK